VRGRVVSGIVAKRDIPKVVKGCGEDYGCVAIGAGLRTQILAPGFSADNGTRGERANAQPHTKERGDDQRSEGGVTHGGALVEVEAFRPLVW